MRRLNLSDFELQVSGDDRESNLNSPSKAKRRNSSNGTRSVVVGRGAGETSHGGSRGASGAHGHH